MRDSIRDNVAAGESYEKDLEGTRWRLGWRGGGAAHLMFKHEEAGIRAVPHGMFLCCTRGRAGCCACPRHCEADKE